jgi:hypothetical protein
MPLDKKIKVKIPPLSAESKQHTMFPLNEPDFRRFGEGVKARVWGLVRSRSSPTMTPSLKKSGLRPAWVLMNPQSQTFSFESS